ncbi:MAG: hypothetical protein LH631_13545, partial [Alkalinema sp. CAN_BIN05]|nr:hypothetical protein [Alkalinema sp. CAN_BIN05]
SMAVNGAGFAGFATWLDITPADPDIFAIPDPTSLFPCNHSALGIGETGIPKAEWLRKITQFLNFKP